jgi:hypothetical protein
VLGICNQTRCSSFGPSHGGNDGPAIPICAGTYGGHLLKSSSVLEVDHVLAQAENLSLGLVSMVSDNLQRMEKPDQISNPIFETALKDAAATAIIGSSALCKECCVR